MGKTVGAARPKAAAFQISGQSIQPGSRVTVEIEMGLLSDHTPMHLVAHVIHGRRPGPAMFVSGAVHGDEIIGVEIIRRLADAKVLRQLRGTLLLVPIVNAYGFVTQSRYLPDRRDLNRSFPGSAGGSLAGQLAHLMMREVVKPCDFGVDLHSGARHRANLPQIRADLGDPEVEQMARAFGAPIVLDSRVRDGSLRQAAGDEGCHVLLYEGGEALRFDEHAIRVGVKGVIQVMRHVGMLPRPRGDKLPVEPVRSNASTWMRAPIGGIMRSYKSLGERVSPGDVIAVVSGPFGSDEEPVVAPVRGLVIGRTNLPVVNRGDALFNIARLRNSADAEERAGVLESALESDPFFEEGIV